MLASDNYVDPARPNFYRPSQTEISNKQLSKPRLMDRSLELSIINDIRNNNL